MRAEISPSTYLHPSASLRSKLWKERHKRRRVYTGSGHRCGVIPYSSVWCGGLPLGLMMMNNTRKNSLTRVCSLLEGDELLGGVQSPFSLSSRLRSDLLFLPCGWLVLFIGKGPGPLPKYFAGRAPTIGHFEGEHLVHLSRLKLVLACTKLWW